MPRVEWSYAGTELLTCTAGTLRRHALDGAITIVDGPHVLDACWHEDGSIVAIDEHELTRRYTGTSSKLIESNPPRGIASALIAGERYLASRAGELFAANIHRRWEWRLDPYKHSLGWWDNDGHVLAALSADGRLAAIAYQTRGDGDAHDAWSRAEGRGWVVFDTSKDEIIDRSWTSTKREASWTRLAFDATGKRLALATTEPGPCVGAIRTDRDEKYPRTHLGGATAVAIDRRGLLAAYAYPEAIAAAERRLRVDYLERGAKGGSAIAITDTLWIDPDITDIVALAFDRASRRIACLGASGTIDVVPVP